MIQKIVSGGFLIVVGMILATTNIGVSLDQFTQFEDEYPYNNDWSNNGTLNNLEQNNKDNLIVSSGSSGTFESQNILKEGELKLDRIVTSVELGGTDDEITLNFETLSSNGAVIQSESKVLDEESDFIPVDSFDNYNGSARPFGYRFTYNISTDGTGTEPKVQTLNVAGSYDLAAEDSIISNLNQVLGLLFVGLGLIMILSIFFGRDW